MKHENLLWQRVAALRGIDVPKRGDRACITGERWTVEVARPARSPHVERAAQRASDPAVRGVVGEIVARPDGAGAGAGGGAGGAVAAGRPTIATPLGWRRALIEWEGERLARSQPERASGYAQSSPSDSANPASSSALASTPSLASTRDPATE
jgi:hypothetical protein